MKLGIVGIAGRGAAFARSVKGTDFFEIHAVCDISEEGLKKGMETCGVEKGYISYDEMLEESGIEAVVVGTPMHLHAEMAIKALTKNIHVLSEVTAAVSIEQCRELVAAANESKALYMMGENYTFIKPNMTVKGLVDKGLFGETYYAEGEYLHDCTALLDKTPWRKKWQYGINGLTYCTHSLGPTLQWFPGDRVISVSCVGTGHHYLDKDGNKYEQEDSTMMMCRLRGGGLIRIRQDFLSARPHAMTNYSLQGTEGSYESARASTQEPRIWLKSRNEEPNEWENLFDLGEEYTPEIWKDEEALEKVGHGGGDLIELFHFRDAILGKVICNLGIHQALDLTLTGLISQESIKQDGAWLEVPDSRDW
ncbi:MAG: Gfo/Idh/MocA family oxidoreductase [Opitutaceae bacterium]|nr:Gfo/Idh/MocA family oxidoreductase [Opitutaceae bacterium]